MESPLSKADERELFNRLQLIAAVGWGIAVFAIGFALGVMR